MRACWANGMKIINSRIFKRNNAMRECAQGEPKKKA